MHAHYRVVELQTCRGVTVEARSEEHAKQLGQDHGYLPAECYVTRLEPSAQRPLLRRFKGCPHCEFLKASGLDVESEVQKARKGAALGRRNCAVRSR